MEHIAGWIFVSHSNKDLKEVRRIRDYLEAKKHHPILFFLKCVSEDDELDILIEREIKARSIFLLCDSPNTRSANWVQREIEIIRSLSERHIETVDLRKEWKSQKEILDRISQRSTLFFSYNQNTHAEVSKLHAELKDFDYSIFFAPQSLGAGDSWAVTTEQAITESLQHGFFLYFVEPSDASNTSSLFQIHELERALAKSPESAANLLVIFVGNPSAYVEIPSPLAHRQALDLRSLSPKSQAQALHRHLCHLGR